MNKTLLSGVWPGFLYIVLLVCSIPVASGSQIQIADLLAPVLLLQLLMFRRRELAGFLLGEGGVLGLFLLIAFGTSVLHFLQHTGGFYDFMVLGYMSVLYVYFRLMPLSSRQKLILGAGMLIFFWVGWVTALWLPRELQGSLFYFAPNYPVNEAGGLGWTVSASGGECSVFSFEGDGFLGHRFNALFGNPNIFGAFFPLPLLMLSEWWSRRYAAARWPFRLLLLAGAFVVCFPLFSSASKHFIMSFAVILASWFRVQRLFRSGCLFHGGALAVVLLGLVCWCTVLVLTFPMKSDFPWVNTDCQSNYSLHQEIYLRMAGHDWKGLLLGRGLQEIRRLYPEYADREKIAAVLKRYHGEHVLNAYCTFMDPHNEYLNLLTFFGVGGLAVMVCFLGGLLIRGLRKRNWVVFYYLTALMMSLLWDDLLSKRFIWVELALVISLCSGGEGESSQSADMAGAEEKSVSPKKVL